MQVQIRDPAARIAPGAMQNFSRLEIRGRRECRVRAAPAVSRAKRVAYRFSGSIRPSLRNGFTAYVALSPAIGLSCHRHRPNCVGRLDVGVETSGPHDFAVRSMRALVSCAPPRPSHPRPCVRDDRDTPLVKGRDGGGNWSDLGETRSKIFLQAGLDRWNHLDPFRQFGVYRKTGSRAKSPDFRLETLTHMARPS